MSRQQYILDTNAVVDILRDPSCMVARRLRECGGVDRCAIVDLTLYELYAGAYASQRKDNNVAAIDRLSDWLQVISSSLAYKEAARQKAMLREKGSLIEDIDILIGCSAVISGRALVSGNLKHMSRLSGLKVIDWSK